MNMYAAIFIITIPLAMHLLADASRPRLSETEPEWFVFETKLPDMRSVGDILSVASQK